MGLAQVTHPIDLLSLAAGADEINLFSDVATGTGIFAQVGQEFPLIKGTKFLRDDNGSIIVNQFGLPTRASSNSILGKATGLHFRTI
jgi:hypothetical protein